MKMTELLKGVVIAVLAGFSSEVLASSMRDAQQAYLVGNYSEVISICSHFQGEYTNRDEALYLTALSYMKMGIYEKARSYFRSLLRNFKGSPFYESALVKLVDTYFLDNDIEYAEKLYKSILRKYPSISYKPLIYLRLAQISAKQGRWNDERKYINLIKTKYPHSVEQKLAERIEKRGYFFTVQVGAFSRYENALHFMKELKMRYRPYIVEEKDGDLTFYKVRVGKYKERQEAEIVFNRLRQEGYPARIYP